MSGVLSVISPSLLSGVFSATVSPPFLTGYSTWAGSVQTDSSTTCNAVNGIPPYTYEWTFVSGDAEITPTSDTSSTTRFFSYFGSPAFRSAVYKCVVTDSAAIAVDSTIVTVELERI